MKVPFSLRKAKPEDDNVKELQMPTPPQPTMEAPPMPQPPQPQPQPRVETPMPQVPPRFAPSTQQRKTWGDIVKELMNHLAALPNDYERTIVTARIMEALIYNLEQSHEALCHELRMIYRTFEDEILRLRKEPTPQGEQPK